jgi:hypothetical protein
MEGFAASLAVLTAEQRRRQFDSHRGPHNCVIGYVKSSGHTSECQIQKLH